MKCPNCGTESNTPFCPACGSPLKGAKCRECNSALPAGANFCVSCGTAIRPQTAARAGWYAAAVLGVLLLAFLIVPRLMKDDTPSQEAGRVPISQMQDDSQQPAGNPPALTGTPREQADRLFNRIMTELEKGDTARAKFFQPMGVQAYENVDELDVDGMYHLGMLQLLGKNYQEARNVAERVLKEEPDHLLALSIAARAAMGVGDAAGAKKYYQHFLSVYDVEIKKSREEYRDHMRIMPDLKSEAERNAR